MNIEGYWQNHLEPWWVRSPVTERGASLNGGVSVEWRRWANEVIAADLSDPARAARARQRLRELGGGYGTR